MNSLPMKAMQYVRLVMLVGAAASIYAVYGYRIPDIWHVLLMTILACHMSTVKLQFKFGGEVCSMSMGFPFIFAAVLMIGLREGIMVAVFSALTQSLYHARDKSPLFRTLFSVAALVLTVMASGLAYSLCRGPLPMPPTYLSAMALIAGAGTYWLVNTGLVSGAVSLTTNKSFWSVWGVHLKWTVLSFTLGGFLAVILVFYFRAVGIGIGVLLCPVFYLLHSAYKRMFVKGDFAHAE